METLPYVIVAVGVSFLAIVAAIRFTSIHHEVRNKVAVLIILASVIWLLMSALGLASDSLPTKLVFFKLQFVGIVIVPTTWLINTMQFSGYERWLKRSNLVLLGAVPVITLLLVFTNQFHGFMWSSITLNSVDAFYPLNANPSLGYWLLIVGYSYVALMLTLTIFVKRVASSRSLYRRQAVPMILVSCFPWALSVVWLLEPTIFMYIDPTALGLTVATSLLFWRLAYLPGAGVAPVAHELILDSMNEAVIILDAQTRILELNPRAQQLVGHNLSDAMGKPVDGIWAEWADVKKELDSGTERVREVSFGVGEEKKIYEMQTSHLSGIMSERPNLLIILRDITERKRMEEEHSRSSQFLGGVVENAYVWLNVLDNEQNVLVWNRAAETMSGYSREEVVGHGKIWEWLYPDQEYRKQIMETVTAVLQSGRTDVDQETRIKRKDGQTRIISWNDRTLTDQNGKAIGTIAIGHDITERKMAEERLRESEERYRSLFDRILDGVYRSTHEGRFVDVNPALVKMFEYSSKQEMMDIADIKRELYFSPEDRASHDLYPGDSEEVESYRMRRKDGSEIWVEDHGHYVHDEQGNIIYHEGILRDITERKRMEEELERYSKRLEGLVEARTADLAASARKYQLLVDNMADAVFTIDLNGNLTYRSPQYEKMTGYSVEQRLSMNIKELIAPEDLPRVLKRLEEHRAGVSGLPPTEFDLVRVDGTRLPVEIHTKLLCEGNKPVGIQGVARDITDRRRMEVALRESEDRLRAIFESVNAGIMIIDPKKHEIVDANPLALKMVGAIKANQVVGSKCHKFVCPAEEGHCPITDLGQSVDNAERVLLRVDGQPTSILKSVTTILNGQEYLLESFVDITERKRMEEALRESEAKFRELADLLPQIVYETDEKGVLTFFNRVGLASTGYAEEDLRNGFNVFQVFPPEDAKRAMESMRRVMEGGRMTPNEYTLLRKDGSSIPVTIYSSAIIREGKFVGLRGIIVDVTERKRMEEDLLRSRHMAAVGETAAMVGHDLRNPLQGIMGAAYLLKTCEDHLGEQGKKMLHLIEDAIQRSDKIINDLLEYSREIQLDLSASNAKSLIGQSLASIKTPENINVVNHTKEQPTVEVDVEKMKRVCLNLMKNAFDAMPKGGTLTITNTESDGNLQVSFADTGVGIRPEILEKIWSPLFTTKAMGMGYGLPIVKRFTEAHGGSVSVETNPGKGSTFTIRIPINRTTNTSKEPQVQEIAAT